MSMQTTSENSSGEPMMEINTTPLIDVMLVLLIMLIITIPPQTHAVKLDLPVNQDTVPPPPIDPVKSSPRRARSCGTAARCRCRCFASISMRRSR